MKLMTSQSLSPSSASSVSGEALRTMKSASGNHGQEMSQPRPQGFSLKKWVGREKALASAGHVHSLNIPKKLIYMQPAGFALTVVERSNNGK